MDITHVTLPQWLTTLIVITVGALLWRAICAMFDAAWGKLFNHRRVGLRATDDFKGSQRMEWERGLIEAMNANAEVNREVAVTLATLSAKQDATLHAFQLTQTQQAELNKTSERVLRLLERLNPAGA